MHSALLFGESDSHPLSLVLNLACCLGSWWWILFNFGIITIHPCFVTSYNVFTEIFIWFCSYEQIVSYRQAVLVPHCCVRRSLVNITWQWNKPHEIPNSSDTSIRVSPWSALNNSHTLLPHHFTGCSPLSVHVQSCSVKQTHTKTCMRPTASSWKEVAISLFLIPIIWSFAHNLLDKQCFNTWTWQIWPTMLIVLFTCNDGIRLNDCSVDLQEHALSYIDVRY